jgi:hypothetical protein
MCAPELSTKRALQAMSRGARLMLMHTRRGLQHFVVPGGSVSADVAKSIIGRPDVVPGDDALFPGHPQTYRMIR